jgi:hypothetical protein
MSCSPRGFCSIAALIVLALGCTAARANDIYIAQNATGLYTGQNCANAYAYTFFNTSSNWGTGANQIGPGTTVHLCGTLTGAAGSTLLTFQGSGASGSPITLHFEFGAILQAPYFAGGYQNAAGAIVVSGKNYITVDGGTNGLIQNTDNGSVLDYQQASTGINIQAANNIEVKNLSLLNLYVRSDVQNEVQPAALGVSVIGASANILVHNLVLSWADVGFQIVYPAGSTMSNVQIYANTVTHTGTAVAAGESNTNAALAGLSIYNNDFSGGSDWWDPNDNYHLNHIHLWSVATGTSVTNVQVYNNYLHGDFGGDLYGPGHQTGSVFMEGSPGTLSGYVYNNLITQTNLGDYASNGLIVLGAVSVGVYNNTLIGNGAAGIGVDFWSGYSGTANNNSISDSGYYMYAQPGSSPTIDYNNYYNGAAWRNGSSLYPTMAAWQAAGFDAHGSMGNPNLSAAYLPTSSSSALIRSGANLTRLGVAALDSDRSGVARPPTGNWDIGAYEFSGGPSAPTGLTTSVH